MRQKRNPSSGALRSEDWIVYQAGHLLTPGKSFDDIATLTERAQRGRDAPLDTLDTLIAPPLDGPLDILRIEQGQKGGHWYSRYGSGPEKALVQRLVDLEAGYAPAGQVDGIATDCGMGAISLALDCLARGIPINERAGMKFLVGNTPYFMTNEIVDENMRDQGFEEAIRVDTTSPEEVRKALEEHRDGILGVFVETISNPLIGRTDIRAIAEIAHEFNKPVIVDNTLLTPYGQQAFRLGADVVIHSLSKYLSGDGKTNGGVVLAPHEFIRGLRGFRSMRGGILSPDACKQIDAGLSKFPGEMEEYTRNARELARYLATVPNVERVHYLAECPDTRNGSGAVFSISLAGASGEEKQQHERSFFEELRKASGPIECKTSFGDGRYGALGQSTFGWGVPDTLKGVVRLSAGLGNARFAIEQLRNVLINVYRGK
ncbi:MAG: PLP-dependent transferase [Nanoarchaeota archaeon]|nr:PLP-dependent transferase [Nanoarchaeota archaeon]